MSSRVRSGLILGLGLTAAKLAAADSEPRMPTLPDQHPQCVYWYDHNGFLTCEGIASNNWISVDEFRQYNPSIGAGCTNLQKGFSYCVEIDTRLPIGGPITTSTTTRSSSTTTSTTSTTSSSTTLTTITTKPTTTTTSTKTTTSSTTTTNAGNGITTPTPLQREIVDNCDAFYMVKENENCDTVAKANGITVAQLAQWNPSVGSNCAGLWADAYACVSIIGHTPTQVNPGNGVQTPSPIQDNMTKSCKTFHFVNGQTCQSVLDKYKISMANFYKWNPAVGNNCQNMWDKTYVCVAVL